MENQTPCLSRRQAVGVKELDHGIWSVGFMDYDLRYLDLEKDPL
jgi:hypothetical protein